MANTRFILNETSYFGFGAREVLLDELKDRGYKRVFLVSDKSLVDAGVTDKVMNILEEGKVRYELYDDVKTADVYHVIGYSVAFTMALAGIVLLVYEDRKKKRLINK